MISWIAGLLSKDTIHEITRNENQKPHEESLVSAIYGWRPLSRLHTYWQSRGHHGSCFARAARSRSDRLRRYSSHPKLLNHYGINTKTISYHEHNENERAPQLLERVRAGLNLAVVSDAGTPGINDPGFRLVQLAHENDVPVIPVPGASALIAALAASGLPTDSFFFAGFLPPRSAARRARLAELRDQQATLVFYEAPHRIAAALKDAREILGDRAAVVARELTKLHEEFARGPLSELLNAFRRPTKHVVKWCCYDRRLMERKIRTTGGSIAA